MGIYQDWIGYVVYRVLWDGVNNLILKKRGEMYIVIELLSEVSNIDHVHI